MEQIITSECTPKALELSFKNYFYYFSFFVISFVMPLLLLFVVKAYAQQNSISLEVGCEGPEMFFGLLSGVLMALQLRFFQAS